MPIEKRHCRYCGDAFSNQGHKTHERNCDERAEEYQGTPPGFENIDQGQTRLGSHFTSGDPEEITPEEREALADQIHNSRATTK